MQNFMETILSAVKAWTKGKIKDSTADWNQNDPNADNYIKNRTHWEEKGIVHKLDSKFLDLPTNLATTDDIDYMREIVDGKMNVNEPVGIGSFTINPNHNYFCSFSLGRLPDTAIGRYSHASGNGVIASAEGSHAVGSGTVASGICSHAEGYEAVASARGSHAEGEGTTASGENSHAEGEETKATGSHSHAEGYATTASGPYSHAEGGITEASGSHSHAEGYWTNARRRSQHVQGEYNINDTEGDDYNSKGKYVHIVGNGTSPADRSNAHTLDWDGNAWFQGDVYVGGVGQNDKSADKLVKTAVLKNEINAPKDEILLIDRSTKLPYRIYMKDGNLVSELAIDEVLKDFEYVVEDDGTYTLTGWKQTLNGQPSTECVIPDIYLINL